MTPQDWYSSYKTLGPTCDEADGTIACFAFQPLHSTTLQGIKANTVIVQRHACTEHLFCAGLPRLEAKMSKLSSVLHTPKQEDKQEDKQPAPNQAQHDA